MSSDESKTAATTLVSQTVAVSPYLLSNSDNPGTSISSITLNGDNYNEWSEEMLNALHAKRKTGFINDTIPQPPLDDPDYENWKTVNSMIVGWIRSSITSKVKSTVTFVSNAHQLWEDLKQSFSVGNEVRVHQIKAQLASCRQDGQSVLDYYAKLCTLWDELHTYCPPPVCSCGGCSCGVTAKFVKETEKEKLHQFLLGLDDARFGGLCTNFVGKTPLPSLGEAYSKVICEEQRLSSACGREQLHDAVGFMARRESHEPLLVKDATPELVAYLGHSDHQESHKLGSSSILKPGSRTLCSHCGRTGHDKRDYWQLIGFPDWWEEHSQGRGNGRGLRGRGSGTGRGRGAVTAHATTSNQSVFPEFSQDQLKLLQQLLAEKANKEKQGTGGGDRLSGKKALGDIILDTEASHHMTGNLSSLQHIAKISPCSVGFADGSNTFALCVGSLPLSCTISLENVLYVPSLNCTLISVSKILKQTKCDAWFSDEFCVLQDRSSKTLIGSGEERDGVYYLKEVVSAKIHSVKAAVDDTL
ncbi:PREDICTED: uncharacterized protein LOC104709792 [Camelina sativa]|uniref:Uncharacterized protein LOC104709792 n=1 Tax=Camelina sativa TaxID=90675 RepID=A0ABM0TDC2_CAMSA|nr:PREDICTED: uncharacterized protein LOC104709792 [Camelina sativa]